MVSAVNLGAGSSAKKKCPPIRLKKGGAVKKKSGGKLCLGKGLGKKDV